MSNQLDDPSKPTLDELHQYRRIIAVLVVLLSVIGTSLICYVMVSPFLGLADYLRAIVTLAGVALAAQYLNRLLTIRTSVISEISRRDKYK